MILRLVRQEHSFASPSDGEKAFGIAISKAETERTGTFAERLVRVQYERQAEMGKPEMGGFT